MKKNILVSLSIIGVLSALIVGGTAAIFFDEEVARDNVFEAGHIDLRLQKEGDTDWRNEETKTWETPEDN